MKSEITIDKGAVQQNSFFDFEVSRMPDVPKLEIHIIQNNEVLKFFKGRKQAFSFEASATPVHFDKIYTTPELQALYILDTKNSRLVSYTKDGKIIAQYFNESLGNASSLSVDEKNKAAYAATSSGLIKISLQ